MISFFLGCAIGAVITASFKDSLLVSGFHAFLYSWFRPREFFDTKDRILNINLKTTWGNLGYWPDNGMTYADAAEALARKLAETSQIMPDDRVLDIGFGQGDQLVLWAESYGVHSLHGYNISRSQTQEAVEKTRNMPGFCLAVGSYQQVSPQDKFDKILALDCAYHFRSRRDFFTMARKQLNPQGKLGLVDLWIDLEKATLPLRILIKTMAWVSNIPSGNIWGEARYRSELASQGFAICKLEDISKEVFPGFNSFILRHHQNLNALVSSSDWFKYQITAWILVRLYQASCLKMVVISATPKTLP